MSESGEAADEPAETNDWRVGSHCSEWRESEESF
jgi:hypothetical protein